MPDLEQFSLFSTSTDAFAKGTSADRTVITSPIETTNVIAEAWWTDNLSHELIVNPPAGFDPGPRPKTPHP